MVTEGKLDALEGQMKVLAQLMIEHPDYQYFWALPPPSAWAELQRALEQGVVNPDIHLQLEATVLRQIENEDPPEAAQAYRALLKANVEPHKARHTVARILTEVTWEVLDMAQRGEQPDAGLYYISKLKRLAKRPLKVLNEQITKPRENSQTKSRDA